MEADIHALDDAALETLRDYWHKLPEGVTSSRTVKNYLDAVKPFARHCRRRYGYAIPEDTLPTLTADSVKRAAVPYDPAKIQRVLARGGKRLRMYTLFGLLHGWYPKDVATFHEDHFYAEGDEHYVHRTRSKESRSKRGSVPLRTKHWVAPELVALIGRFHRPNAHGLMILNKHGVPMYRETAKGQKSSAAAKAWERACSRAGVNDLPFSQLRKIGYNAIKRISKSHETARIWKGKSLDVEDAYDDGIFQPVLDAMRVWADELRRDGILATGQPETPRTDVRQAA